MYKVIIERFNWDKFEPVERLYFHIGGDTFSLCRKFRDYDDCEPSTSPLYSFCSEFYCKREKRAVPRLERFEKQMKWYFPAFLESNCSPGQFMHSMATDVEFNQKYMNKNRVSRNIEPDFNFIISLAYHLANKGRVKLLYNDEVSKKSALLLAKMLPGIAEQIF